MDWSYIKDTLSYHQKKGQIKWETPGEANHDIRIPWPEYEAH